MLMQSFRSNKPIRPLKHTETGSGPFDNRPSKRPEVNSNALRPSNSFDLVRTHVRRDIIMAEAKVVNVVDIRTETERPRMGHTSVTAEQAARVILHQELKQ